MKDHLCFCLPFCKCFLKISGRMEMGRSVHGTGFREKSRSWIWDRVMSSAGVIWVLAHSHLKSWGGIWAEDIQEVVDTVLDQGKAWDSYLGGRILKFLFQMCLDGGATFRRVIPVILSGSGWCVQEWKVIGSKNPGLEWRLRCSVVWACHSGLSKPSSPVLVEKRKGQVSGAAPFGA